ncbi:MAG: DUF4386 family protein [Candidatus Geothermarchaeales archaeon]
MWSGDFWKLDPGEKRLLQMGGLGGILAGLVAIALFALFFVAPAFPTFQVEDTLIRLGASGQDRALFILVQALTFLLGLLTMTLFLALYRILREANLGYALFGSAIGVVGSSILAVGYAIAAITGLRLADQYAAASATEKEAVLMLALLFDGILTWGFLIPTFILFGIAFLALGAAIRRGGPFSKTHGNLSVIFGAIVLVGIALGPFGIIAYETVPIIWFILIGVKVYRLSGAT